MRMWQMYESEFDLDDDIVYLNPRRVIFNPGTENYDFMQQASNEGIEVVEGCTLVMLRSGQY